MLRFRSGGRGRKGWTGLAGRFAAVFLLVGVISGLMGCSPSTGATQTPTSEAPTTGLISLTKTILNGTLIIPGGQTRDLYFEVNSQMTDMRLVGWFRAAGGAGSDIQMLVLDDNNFQTYDQGQHYSSMYDSGRKTLGQVDINIPGGFGDDHVIFSNKFSTATKSVQAEIDLQYYGPLPTPTPTFSPETVTPTPTAPPTSSNQTATP